MNKSDYKILNRCWDKLDEFVSTGILKLNQAQKVYSMLGLIVDTKNMKDPDKIISLGEYRTKQSKCFDSELHNDEIKYQVKEAAEIIERFIVNTILKIGMYKRDGFPKCRSSNSQKDFLWVVKRKLNEIEDSMLSLREMLNDFSNCNTNDEIDELLFNLKEKE